jgi:7-keto-8-aminopelargonate synthetase-like enzyme
LSKAKRFVYPHADCDALERMLRDSNHFRRRLIVTDTLFSMDGDFAPLVRLAELAESYNAMLMVDEAHATGVFGENGRGVVEFLGSVPFFDASASSSNPNFSKKGTDPLHDRVHIRVGTLSKALGSSGGFVCGRQSLIDWLANRARSYVYSTAPPAASSAAALAALEIVRTEPHRRTELLKRAADLRLRLSAQGWKLAGECTEYTIPSTQLGESKPPPTGSTSRSPSSLLPTPCYSLDAPRSQLTSQIISLVISDANRAMRLAAHLREAGFFVPGIRPPSVPEGESLLRLSLCYHHTPQMIDGLADELGRVGSGK